MNPYMNEDVAFERLKDLQREMENSRLLAGSIPSLGSLIRNLAARAWWISGLALGRAAGAPVENHHPREDRSALGG